MQKGNGLVTKVLMHEVSIWQLVIYALGVFIGMFMVTIAMQFYLDLSRVDNKNKVNSHEFIVMSPRVEGLSFSSRSYSLEKVLADLTDEPWVEKAAAFVPADFNVTATVEFAGRGMSTAMFLETVPDEFLEAIPNNWNFDPDEINPIVPIIVPRDYLALYNFGFAASRGLPKIGENVLTTIPLELSFSGNGKQRTLRAGIVGFTSRLNTIAVPSEVIDWGNREFGTRGINNVSRLIAEIRVEPNDKLVTNFMSRYNLEIGGDKGLAGSATHIMKIIVTVVVIIGCIIGLLAIALLFISIFLLLHKTRDIIYRLLMMGYTRRMIVIRFTTLFGLINLLVLCLCITGDLIAQGYFRELLEDAGMMIGATVLVPVFVAFGIAVLITVLCQCLLGRAVSKVLRP